MSNKTRTLWLRFGYVIMKVILSLSYCNSEISQHIQGKVLKRISAMKPEGLKFNK